MRCGVSIPACVGEFAGMLDRRHFCLQERKCGRGRQRSIGRSTVVEDIGPRIIILGVECGDQFFLLSDTMLGVLEAAV